MFKFIFYFFGVVAIMYEWWSVYNYDKIKILHDKVNKTEKEKLVLNLTENEKYFVALQFLYMMWALVGIFSSQWILFVILIGISIFNKWFASKEWNYVDSILSIGLIGFAIVNTYHLHINVGKKILGLFAD